MFSKLKHFADPLDAGWSSRKLLKSRKNLDRSTFSPKIAPPQPTRQLRRATA
jgi:hypothetical protein